MRKTCRDQTGYPAVFVSVCHDSRSLVGKLSINIKNSHRLKQKSSFDTNPSFVSFSALTLTSCRIYEDSEKGFLYVFSVLTIFFVFS